MREGAGVIRQLLEQASQLREAGRYAEAEAAYESVLALDANQPTCWYNLGFVQRQQGRFEEALASYEEALKRGVNDPEEVHLNRAVIYADHLRREDKAERELNAALARNRRYAPALFNLANLKEDRGHRADAMALYEQVLAIAPGAHEALARLAQIAPVKSAEDAMVRRVRAALASPQISPAARASLGFALGRMLDQAGAYDAAFDAYAEANRASRASAGGRARYDRAAEEQFIDDIIAASPAVGPSMRSEAHAPIFICGMFRSGSTLTEQVLAGHPRVTAGGELDLLPAMAREVGFPAGLRDIGDETLQQLARRYRARLAELFPNADYVTDKRPDNFLYVGLIKRLFPDAKIVHTMRHPLDNVLSIYFLHLDHGMGYALDLMDAAHHYRQYRRLMAHWKHLYGADILDFDYDTFVREPRPAAERLLAFLGLEWTEECLAFHRRSNSVKTASVWQVREPLYKRASGRWRNYASQLEPVRDALADLIED
jgi:tetratricopeptide (TPR) repeat protein